MESLVEQFFGSYKDKKVLLTGDSGFKGSWLAIWLLQLGAEVYGYALPPKTEKDNCVVTKLMHDIKHVDGDIRDAEKLSGFLNEAQPEVVFHLAAQPLVLDSYENPKYTFETNILGTVNLFEAVRLSDSVKAVINITTDKCYRNNEWVWGYRENDPMGGKDPYSASKACSELVTTSYVASFLKNINVNVASARAGNVIGAGDWAENRIVPDFFRAKVNKERLIIRNPAATRPWQHVLEPLSGYLLLGAKLMDSNEFEGGWNFGPKDEMNYSVEELIEMMNSFDGSVECEMPLIKNKPLEANLLKLDISKAVVKLGWKPILDFKDTVKLAVDGYNTDLEGSSSFENRVDSIKYYTDKAKKIVQYL